MVNEKFDSTVIVSVIGFYVATVKVPDFCPLTCSVPSINSSETLDERMCRGWPPRAERAKSR